jgi:hypothetical protein
MYLRARKSKFEFNLHCYLFFEEFLCFFRFHCLAAYALAF